MARENNGELGTATGITSFSPRRSEAEEGDKDLRSYEENYESSVAAATREIRGNRSVEAVGPDTRKLLYGENISAHAQSIKIGDRISVEVANGEMPVFEELYQAAFLAWNNQLVANVRHATFDAFDSFINEQYNSHGVSVIDVSDITNLFRDIIAGIAVSKYRDLTNEPVESIVQKAMTYGEQRNGESLFPEEKQFQAAVAVKDFSTEFANKIASEVQRHVGAQEARVVADNASYQLGDYIRDNIDSKGFVDGHDASTVAGLMLISNHVFKEAGRYQFNEVDVVSNMPAMPERGARNHDLSDDERINRKFSDRVAKSNAKDTTYQDKVGKKTKPEKSEEITKIIPMNHTIRSLESVEQSNPDGDMRVLTRMNVKIGDEVRDIELNLTPQQYAEYFKGASPPNATNAQAYSDHYASNQGHAANLTAQTIDKRAIAEALKDMPRSFQKNYQQMQRNRA